MADPKKVADRLRGTPCSECSAGTELKNFWGEKYYTCSFRAFRKNSDSYCKLFKRRGEV